MLKRIKQLWTLSRKDPKALEILEALTPEQIEIIPEAPDGKAVFFAEPTPEEQLKFEREEEGTLPWYERINKL